MPDTGSIGWLVVGGIVGGFIGYKMLPAMKRVDEVDKLLGIAQRMFDMAPHEQHKFEVLEQIQKLKNYRKGILDNTKDTTDEEHEGTLEKFKSVLRFVHRKINPFSKNGSSKSADVDIDAELEPTG